MKSSVGERLVKGLGQLTEAMERGDAISERYTCRRIVLNLEPTSYDRALVKETRDALGMSQAVFAKFLGVSTKTVSSWEQGLSTPGRMACRFMDEIRMSPKFWKGRLNEYVVAK